MNENVFEFPDQKAIEEEAAAWLIKLDGDTAPSVDELAALREWLDRSPVHHEKLSVLADIWGEMNVLTELAVPLGLQGDSAKRSVFESLLRAIPRFGRAGIVMAVTVIGITSFFLLQPNSVASSNGLYATAVGQQQSVTLVDKSVVLLNTNSQVSVDYDDEYRNIRLLQGEAHFTVKTNSERPFRVYAGNGRVQAVGTAFSVYLKENTIDVIVTEGKVALASVSRLNNSHMPQQAAPQGTKRSSGTNTIVDSEFVETLGAISAGENATIQSTLDDDIISTVNAVETVEARELAKRLSWREGMLTFSGDPLEFVVDEISRYTTVTIEITDPAVRATRIGGRFPIGETDAMLDALEANFGLSVIRVSHNHVLVSMVKE